MNTVTSNCESFAQDLSNYFPKKQVTKIASKVKTLFDRACEVKTTARLSTGCCKKELKSLGFDYDKESSLLSPGVYSFIQEKKNKKFFESLSLMDSPPEDPLQKLASIYNTHYKHNLASDTVFALMLAEGKDWLKKAQLQQIAVSSELEERDGKIVGYTSLAVIGLLVASFVSGNFWLWIAALALLLTVYVSLGVKF